MANPGQKKVDLPKALWRLWVDHNDPNSDLSKDEQKKAYWLAQSHNNVLVSKTMNAMAVEKKPEPPKEKNKKLKKEKRYLDIRLKKKKKSSLKKKRLRQIAIMVKIS